MQTSREDTPIIKRVHKATRLMGIGDGAEHGACAMLFRYGRRAVVVDNCICGHLRHLRLETFFICRSRVPSYREHRASSTPCGHCGITAARRQGY